LSRAFPESCALAGNHYRLLFEVGTTAHAD
jgi:hypothetical protein